MAEYYIANKDHPLFLEAVEVIDKDDFSYRVKILDKNSKYYNSMIWIPKEWLEVIIS